MNSKDKKILMMRNGSIKIVLLKMGIPTMIGMIVSALYSIVDAYFAGWLGTQQIGAISVAFPIVQIIIGLGMMFGTGAASYISRLLGSDNEDKANRVASTALFTSMFIGIITIIITLFFMNIILRKLGATDTILPFAREYAYIYVSGAILTIFNVTMNNLVTAEGRTKLTMTSMIVGGGLNIVLDPIFIFVLNLGIRGAALATVVAQICTTIIYLIYLKKGKGCLKIRLSLFTFDKAIYIEILKIGAPILIYQLLTSISMGMTNSAASIYGDSAVAAFGVVMRIITIITYVVFGFLKGFQPFVGYNYGAKQYDRVDKSIKIVLIWTTLFCLLFYIFTFFFSESLIAIFTKNDDLQMIEIGVKTLKLSSLGLLFFGFQQVYMSLFLALGKGKQGGLLSISRQGFFFIPLIIILPLVFGLNGVIWTQCIADLLTTLLTLNFALKFHQEFLIKKVSNKEDVYQKSSIRI
ncbi:MAG: MATE family efflux transporter [Pleomorphochaeta sp.]